MTKTKDITFFENKLLQFITEDDPLLSMLQWVTDKPVEVEVGYKIPHDIPFVAKQVAGDCTVSEIPRSHQEGCLYNQCDRIPELLDPKGYQKPSVVPLDLGCHETCIHGLAEYLEKVDYALTGLGRGSKPIRNHLRRSGAVMILSFTQKRLQAQILESLNGTMLFLDD